MVGGSEESEQLEQSSFSRHSQGRGSNHKDSALRGNRIRGKVILFISVDGTSEFL